MKKKEISPDLLFLYHSDIYNHSNLEQKYQHSRNNCHRNPYTSKFLQKKSHKEEKRREEKRKLEKRKEKRKEKKRKKKKEKKMSWWYLFIRSCNIFVR